MLCASLLAFVLGNSMPVKVKSTLGEASGYLKLLMALTFLPPTRPGSTEDFSSHLRRRLGIMAGLGIVGSTG